MKSCFSQMPIHDDGDGDGDDDDGDGDGDDGSYQMPTQKKQQSHPVEEKLFFTSVDTL